MIVDGHVHAADRQILDGALKLDLIFVRVDPKLIQIRPCESRYFESHQGDVAGEWQIPIDEMSEIMKPWNREFVKHDPDFHWLFVSSQTMEALDRLIESASRLHDVVMLRRIVRIQRYANREAGMNESHERVHELRPRKPSSVGEHVNIGFW